MIQLRPSVLTSLIALVAWSVGAQAVPALPEEVPEEVLEDARGSYIFVFLDEVTPGEIRGLTRRLLRSAGGNLRHVYTKAIKGFSADVSEHAALRVAASPQIAYFEPNDIVWVADRSRWAYSPEEDDTARGVLGSPPELNSRLVLGPPDEDGDDISDEPAQVTPWGVIRVGGPRDGTGREAWIIDTGIDLDHPDLNVGYGANFVLLGGADTPDDGNGHGTHVAGTVAALDNDIDVVGVAANARVHPVRVLGNGGWGTIDAIVAGIDFVAKNALPGDAANMSLGALGHQQSLHDAVVKTADLGIRFAIAAGNEAADAADYEPAHVDHPNVFTVSAIDDRDIFANFSNFGNPPVDFAAPGVAVLSTANGGGVTVLSGTSMASPHVCGILLFQTPNADGTAIADPDGVPDPIAHF